MQLDLKIGDISYLNTLPLRLGLSRLGIKEVFLGPPNEVNKALLSGEVDLGPVSSIFYLQNKEKFLALKDICISSKAEVKSVIFISRYPWEKLEGKVVSLTRASATSRHLLQVIFKEKGKNPVFVEGELEMFERGEVDASLLIGDTALRVYFNYFEGEKNFYLYDLGKEWKELTGKPVVFALWVVRRDVALCKPSLVRKASQILWQALENSLSNLDVVVEKARKESGIKEEYLRDYYRGLNYSFTGEFLDALLDFYQRALPHLNREIEFFSPQISLTQICEA